MKKYIISKIKKIHNKITYQKIRRLELKLLKTYLKRIKCDIELIIEIECPTSEVEQEYLELAIQNFEKHTDEIREEYIVHANNNLTDYIIHKQNSNNEV